jgi:hypothetical protein
MSKKLKMSLRVGDKKQLKLGEKEQQSFTNDMSRQLN